MARTTAEKVGKVIEVDPEVDLDPFIEAATLLVDEVCVPFGHSEARLTVIETWLAAHFYGVFDHETQVAQEWIGAAIGTQYRGKAELGLNLTKQGQQAMILDTGGGLAKVNAQAQNPDVSLGLAATQIMWLGNPDQLPSAVRQQFLE